MTWLQTVYYLAGVTQALVRTPLAPHMYTAESAATKVAAPPPPPLATAQLV